MGDVVKLTVGRVRSKTKLPKPVECKECGEGVETARLQLVPSANRCVSCATAWERRFDRQMEGVRDHETIKIIR